MGNESNSRASCSINCCGCLFWIVIFALVFSFCNRQDKDKSFIDNSIEYIHNSINHVDSVWNKGNNKENGS